MTDNLQITKLLANFSLRWSHRSYEEIEPLFDKKNLLCNKDLLIASLKAISSEGVSIDAPMMARGGPLEKNKMEVYLPVHIEPNISDELYLLLSKNSGEWKISELNADRTQSDKKYKIGDLDCGLVSATSKHLKN